ncbi:histidine phosphatase family protein [Hyphomonas jannaschiana]|uniref:Phosphoglycerate mutase n=1 Tax=Hyphomonas jannaschiana VP2 TaxID=1280952 RepID=A0A059F8R7_9PROT|nr:histidine phosphatase family protein [Hyphomonas jannaschiana]KCZ86987.1 phosphoglycerate mutase [Hyphomonas jannaschiana VP2]
MIYLVRHGEAAASWGNHPDPGLSELGHKQAEAAAATLIGLGARSAVCSPMQRCRDTAAAFERQADVTAQIEPVVSEIETPVGVHDRVEWLRSYMAGTWEKEGAAHDAWRKKIAEALSLLPDNTAVFSHFVAINAVVSLIDQDSRTTVFRPGHCSITKVDFGGAVPRVIEYGSQAATRVL